MYQDSVWVGDRLPVRPGVRRKKMGDIADESSRRGVPGPCIVPFSPEIP